MVNKLYSKSGNTVEKTATYSSTNTYATLNSLSGTTRNVWIIFHGIGYLSHKFLRYFDELPPNENYLIAPQAPSKYYIGDSYRHVGASWLTRENKVLEIGNVLKYLDAVYEAESIPAGQNLVLFGFSQGVSIATRWLASRKIPCHSLILYAGTVPGELTPSDFSHLEPGTTVLAITGDQDPYFDTNQREQEDDKLKRLFSDKVQHLEFNGGHEVKKEIINQLI